MASDEEMEPTQAQTQSQGHNISSSLWQNVDSDADIWGRLQAKNINLKNLDLSMETFTAGRSTNNDFCFSAPEIPEKILLQLSKVHFKIKKDIRDPSNPAYIEDQSRNGTYLNREKIGCKQKRILAHNDVIAISHPAYKAYQFKDQRRHNHDIPKSITNKYHIGRILGSGACGTVFKVWNLRTCNAYALKHVQKNSLVQYESDKSLNEAKIMKALRHPGVIKMLEIIDEPGAVFFVLELMKGGDLLSRIQANIFLPEKISKLFFYQMCHAIKYLHDRKITHRDLKPDNILLANKDNETLIKISDFGLSKLVQNNSVMRTVCGTPLYVAPEILLTNGRGEYSQKVDVWSLGVVLFTCLSGTLPFANEYGTPATEQIKTGTFKFRSSNWNFVSDMAKKLIKDILTTNVEKRPSIDQLLNHPWLADDYAMLCTAHKLMNLPKPPKKEPPKPLIATPTLFARPFSVPRVEATMNEQVASLAENLENVPIQPPPNKRRRLK